MKIAAAVIAHQAEDKIRELLDSIKDQVDLIVVGIDSKTTDGTETVARSYGATTFPFDLNDDFSQARQQTFAKAKELGATHILWIDTDDILEMDAGMTLRKLVEEHKDASLIWLDYAYARDAYQNVTTLFQRERVINLAFEPRWLGRLHETCTVDGRGTMVRDKRVWVLHKNRTEAGKSERNFRILEKMVAADPNDHRAVLYLGHQYFASQQWNEAAHWYKTFTDLRSPGTPQEEKWQAHIYRAKALRAAKRLEESIQSANTALLLRPQYADAYFELAASYAEAGGHKKAVHWHEEGLRREQPDTILIQNPLDYHYNPYVVVHRSYAEIGRLDKAIECVSKALEWRANEEGLISSLSFYHWAKERDESIAAGLKMIEFLLDAGEVEKAEKALAAFPAGTEGSGLEKARSEIASRLAHLKDEAEYDLFYVDEEVKATDALSDAHAWAVSRLRKQKKVLDIGIGDGSLALALARDGVRVVGVDVDPKRVRAANFAAVAAGLLEDAPAPDYSDDPDKPIRLPVITPESKVQFHYGDGSGLPQRIKDMGPFDAVYLGGLLTRVPDPEKVLNEADSVGKRVLIAVPDGAHPRTWEDNRKREAGNGQLIAHGRVRAWSQHELEGLLYKRGRMIESRRYGEDALVNEYIPGEVARDRSPVAIYCGPGWEPWTPDQIDGRGLGGSETAVVHLAKELVARGLRVMVYGEAEGIWDGVYYRHHSKFRPLRPVFMFVAWRTPEAFDAAISAEQKILWMHDTDAGNRLTEKRAESITTVWCLSEWHKRHLSQAYPFIKDKLVIIGNGLDPTRFDGEETRSANRIAYSSSPDRGLEQVLGYWPKVREKLPDAELHIFYGFDNYDRMGGDRAFRDHILRLADQPGVLWRGRVGQRDLARELMRSSALFYPGPHPFCETFAISVLEAQAAGCVPVTRDNGALPETNKYGIKLANLSEDDRWVDALVLAAGRPEHKRQAMKAWARNDSWAAVAERVIQQAIRDGKAREEAAHATRHRLSKATQEGQEEAQVTQLTETSTPSDPSNGDQRQLAA